MIKYNHSISGLIYLTPKIYCSNNLLRNFLFLFLTFLPLPLLPLFLPLLFFLFFCFSSSRFLLFFYIDRTHINSKILNSINKCIIYCILHSVQINSNWMRIGPYTMDYLNRKQLASQVLVCDYNKTNVNKILNQFHKNNSFFNV